MKPKPSCPSASRTAFLCGPRTHGQRVQVSLVLRARHGQLGPYPQHYAQRLAVQLGDRSLPREVDGERHTVQGLLGETETASDGDPVEDDDALVLAVAVLGLGPGDQLQCDVLDVEVGVTALQMDLPAQRACSFVCLLAASSVARAEARRMYFRLARSATVSMPRASPSRAPWRSGTPLQVRYGTGEISESCLSAHALSSVRRSIAATCPPGLRYHRRAASGPQRGRSKNYPTR